jgi:hypothetical protein
MRNRVGIIRRAPGRIDTVVFYRCYSNRKKESRLFLPRGFQIERIARDKNGTVIFFKKIYRLNMSRDIFVITEKNLAVYRDYSHSPPSYSRGISICREINPGIPGNYHEYVLARAG